MDSKNLIALDYNYSVSVNVDELNLITSYYYYNVNLNMYQLITRTCRYQWRKISFVIDPKFQLNHIISYAQLRTIRKQIKNIEKIICNSKSGF